jgi:predicted short-subunit dehydrogenase-like oxidoreductase (DUF2520 family)
MIKVSIIGTGNVAYHLAKEFEHSENVELIEIISRSTINNDKFLSNKQSTNLSFPKDADVYIIAVSDSAIEEVAQDLKTQNKLVVHTSGGTELHVLHHHDRKGAFYPLQTFSKLKKVNFSEIPICIEAENENDYKLLEALGLSISNNINRINSKQRKALHVAAVFVCNFVNHLYAIGQEICNQNKVDFKLLQPLILETANKILELSPIDAQTGPAKRNDTQTIAAHLNFLTNENQSLLYKTLTQSIIDYGKKL